ncbi:MAG: hypothetical protein AAGA71_21865 [Pseudomonadota bacterium]
MDFPLLIRQRAATNDRGWQEGNLGMLKIVRGVMADGHASLILELVEGKRAIIGLN